MKVIKKISENGPHGQYMGTYCKFMTIRRMLYNFKSNSWKNNYISLIRVLDDFA